MSKLGDIYTGTLVDSPASGINVLTKNNMAILKQISDSLAYYQGWYGICPEHSENNCEDLPLIQGTFPTLTKKYPEILKIELISGNSQPHLLIREVC